MIKVFSSNDWHWSEPDAAIVKVASGSLKGRDLSDFVKRAGHHMLPYVDRLRPGEVAVHLNAMGATEAVGPNRHGDGFKAASLEKDHPTFESGNAFRNHVNGPDALRYGRIIKAAYHKPMRRVELLVGYYGTKEAAERGGPLARIADKEIERVERGDPLAVSMAVKIAHDVCGACGNKAAHRGEYCDDRDVKLASGRVIKACPRGGVKRAMCKVHDDGFMNHVDNPSPLKFFDISWVPRGADRTAFAFGVLGKAAGFVATPRGGAYIAESYGLQDPGTCASPAVMSALTKLAFAESAPSSPAAGDLALRYDTEIPFPPSNAPADECWRALADVGVILPADDWLKLAAGPEAAASASAALRAALPTAFGNLLSEGPSAVATYYEPSSCEPLPDTRAWAAKVAELRDFDPDRMARRAVVAVASGRDNEPAVKSASAPSPAGSYLAAEYASYAAHALAAILPNKSAFPVSLVTRRNALR